MHVREDRRKKHLRRMAGFLLSSFAECHRRFLDSCAVSAASARLRALRQLQDSVVARGPTAGTRRVVVLGKLAEDVVMKSVLRALTLAVASAALASAQIFSEFQPNPDGDDPDTSP
eukprot:scaffold4686_cov230-Pinguiococcus_pyrenoidosus.AAC.8